MCFVTRPASRRPGVSPASCEPVQQFHNEQLANIGFLRRICNGPCRLFTETLFSAMSSMQKEKPKQLNPLLPGYAFDVSWSRDDSPSSGERAGFHHRQAPRHEGVHRQSDHQGQRDRSSGDKAFTVEPGDLLLFPPAAVHHYGRAPDAREWYHRWVYFGRGPTGLTGSAAPGDGAGGATASGQTSCSPNSDTLFLDIEGPTIAVPMSEQLA